MQLRTRRVVWFAGPLMAALAGCIPDTKSLTSGARAPTATAVPVLMYHEIPVTTARPGPVNIALDRFEEQMRFLADHGYTTLSVADLVAFLHGRPVPQRSVVLTFDDGWNSVQNAVPIIKAHGFKAAFFIITGCADGRFGPDYLSWEQTEALAREPLFTVGSHSVTHPWNPEDNLLTWAEGQPAGKTMADVRFELVESKKVLEAHLHRPVRYWAWPCGWASPALIREAQGAGYEAQLTTIPKSNLPGDSPASIRRYFVEGTWDIEAFARFLEQAVQRPL